MFDSKRAVARRREGQTPAVTIRLTKINNTSIRKSQIVSFEGGEVDPGHVCIAHIVQPKLSKRVLRKPYKSSHHLDCSC